MEPEIFRLSLLITSLLAGILSVLAPCAISMIPILIGRNSTKKTGRSAWWIMFGLAGSMFVFTILLKASTVLIDIPASFWQYVSGIIILLFGITSIFPKLWETIALKLQLQQASAKLSRKGLSGEPSIWGDLLIGASLGPVFTSCSPTYALIVATVLPASPSNGILYLLAFIAGLVGMLWVIALGGQKLIEKIGWSLNPNGNFRKILGIIFLAIGILIITGLDKDILSWLVEKDLFEWQINLEEQLQ